jgi:alkanesulfonate monooxygenase SsuD/methylene tetrahydromethanopterin reductase-like flavin-dependent oxidoreductase (luciferase family)
VSIRVGVGSPAGIPGSDPELVLDWARRADATPCSSLGVIDRLAYGSHDPFAVLAAAAAVTGRIRLATCILIAPLRDPRLLARQAATVAALSGGRLTLGVAVGARADDYHAAGLDPRGRGRRLSDQLGVLRDAFDQPGKPASPGQARPELLVGGQSGAALARMARYGDGYVHGGGPPRAFAGAAERARAAWADAGRPGTPRLWGMAYFAFGDAAEAGRDYVRDYYAFTGAFAERIAEGVLTHARAVTELVRGYEDAGCDELLLFPTVARPDQLDRLADALC